MSVPGRPPECWSLLRALEAAVALFHHAWLPWKHEVQEELNQRLAIREHVALRVMKELRLRVTDDIGAPRTIRPSGVGMVFDVVLTLALDPDAPAEFAVTAGAEGEFFVNGVSGGRFADSEQASLETLARLPTLLAAEPAAHRLREIRASVEKLRRETSDRLREIVASYYLPGTCRSCKMFGI